MFIGIERLEATSTTFNGFTVRLAGPGPTLDRPSDRLTEFIQKLTHRPALLIRPRDQSVSDINWFTSSAKPLGSSSCPPSARIA